MQDTENHPETPRPHAGEYGKPFKTLEQRSDPIRPRFTALPWGRVEGDQEIGNMMGRLWLGKPQVESGMGWSREPVSKGNCQACTKEEGEERDHQTGVP